MASSPAIERGLRPEQVEHFHREGYVIVESLLDPELDLAPIIREYDGLLDRLAKGLHESGKISCAHDGLPFGERVVKIYAESGTVHQQYFDFTLPLGTVREDTPIWLGPAVFNVIRNEKILDAVESLIGAGELLKSHSARAHQAARASHPPGPRDWAAVDAGNTLASRPGRHARRG